MPRPSFPPTPQPSTDITGKSSANAPQLESGFTLPPAALNGRGSVASSSGPSEAASDSSYRPPSPASPVATTKPSQSRKRSNTTSQQGVVTKDDYSLPPPPTRSRKIIQMKPKDAQDPPTAQLEKTDAKAAAEKASGGKRKQAGNTTAAGRKIARKTAHSLIERRRRSKMNEEFGVLKDMIPACRDQEMHKLAILQASIEYMRYLEQCVADLKTASQARHETPSSTASKLAPPPLRRDLDDDDEDGEEDEDEDMRDVVSPTRVVNAIPMSAYDFATASPAIRPSDRGSVYSHSATTSPAMHAQDRNPYSAHPSPALQPSDPHRYSLASVTSPSLTASPAFSAQASQTPTAAMFSNPFRSGPPSSGPMPAHGSAYGAACFALTSPALGPQADREDQIATEALMMLNSADRRSWSGHSVRGMSVKDLLSG
ncbi:helix-loop-helix DNA-binding domain-containing protein [Stagonosporopsis vannaccii]|nr:helix-loop-helix DNA-binding domain-containing protein [Stagonosporopsis vannaccii]